MDDPAIKDVKRSWWLPQPATRFDPVMRKDFGPAATVARWAYSAEELRVVASNRLKMQNGAIDRQGNPFGLLYNLLAGEDPDYVEFRGRHLSQLLEIGGYGIPAALRGGTNYLVRRDVVEECLAASASSEPVSTHSA